MAGLTLAVRLFCVVAFVTGGLDLVDGMDLLVSAGAPVERVAADPVLNSQVRFWGAIWFGFGLVLWRTSSRLRAEAGLFRLLCAVIALSGLARLASALLYGLPGAILTGAMILELAAAAGFAVWHAAALRRTDADEPAGHLDTR